MKKSSTLIWTWVVGLQILRAVLAGLETLSLQMVLQVLTRVPALTREQVLVSAQAQEPI